MRKCDVAYLVSCVFVSVYALSYGATILFRLKLPRYYPLEHTWKMIKQQGVPSQGWYGMTAFAFVCSAIIASLSYVLIRSVTVRRESLSPLCVKLVGAISLLVLIGCMVYTALHEFLKWGVF